MQEYEPKLKKKIVTKEFLSKYAYVLVLAILLLGGISYGLTFFIQDKKIATGNLSLANLTINFTDRTINASGLSVPNDDAEGLTEYSKSLTITNTTSVDGVVNLKLTRTSGAELTDLRYAIVINGAIQEIKDVPTSGKILETAIMGNETLNVEVKLWPKSGNATTFVGEITPEIKYLGSKAVTSISSPAGKYVNFNCNNGTCEKWQVVKIEDGRLVLTTQSDYSGATARTNSNRYDSTLGLHDDGNLITSVSTDGKNVYLAKTVKTTDGSGTVANPYTLINNDFREPDKKVIAQVTYKDENNNTLSTQPIYYNQDNYVSYYSNDYANWLDTGNNIYSYDDLVTITSDTVFTPRIVNPNYTVNFKYGLTTVKSESVSPGNSITIPSFYDFYDDSSNIGDFYTTHGYAMYYTFDNFEGYFRGWYLDPAWTNLLSSSSNAFTYTPTGDVDIYFGYDPFHPFFTQGIIEHNDTLSSSHYQFVSAVMLDSNWNVSTTNSSQVVLDSNNNLVLQVEIYGYLYGVNVTYLNTLTNENVVVRYGYYPCLLSGTEVTVEVLEEDEKGKKKKKWKKKKIEDITYDDDLVVWDFDHGCFATAKPLWIMEQKETDEYYNIKFEDGSELNAVTAHRIFNLDLNKFTYLNDDKLTPIGTRVYKEDGTITRIASKKKVYEVSKYHNIVTEYHLNLFANGILTSCRLNNMYEIKDMKFVKDDRILREREEFEGIDDKYIDGFRLLEQPRDDINKLGAVYHGATLKEYVITNFLNHKK